MAKILIVEDDPTVANAVQEALTAGGHLVEHVVTGEDAIYRLKYFHYDLAILDWVLPDISGVSVCQTFRSEGGKIPVLMLTGRSDTSDKVEALDIGADDYLTKPFSYRELMARVRAMLRRPSEMDSKSISVAHLEMDLSKRMVLKNGEPLELNASEFSLLELFMKNRGRIFSSDEILEKVFSTESEATDEAVRQRVFRLRSKIDRDGAPVSLIKTIRGMGYKMEEE